jgi:hypothetical protein
MTAPAPVKKIWLGILGWLVLAATAAQAQFTFTTNNGAITITGYTGPGGAVTIPATMDGLPVTAIGDYAFQSCTSLTKVTIPGGVTSLGDNAFQSCTSLSYVTIPASVTSIGDGAFNYCPSLTNFTISSSVTNVGNDAFGYCYSLPAINVDSQNSFYSSVNGVLFDKNQDTLLQCPAGLTGNYTIPGSVANIADEAFAGCYLLTNIIIPGSVVSIGSDAFYYCNSLTNLMISGSVTNIGDGAFGYCSSLTAITVDPQNSFYSSINGALCDISQTTLLQCPGGLAGNYTVPVGVTTLGDMAFQGCFSLTNVTLSSTVTNIEDGAFGYDSPNLTAISVDPQNSFFSSTNGVLFDKNQATLILCPFGLTGSYTVPNGVTAIGVYAFESCVSLTNIIIPNSVTNLGDWAFFACTNLTYLTIPDGVTTIGNGVFQDCTSLTSVTIPGSVTSMGWILFAFCPNLTNVVVANGVTTIGDASFESATSLMSVTIPGSVTSIEDGAFYGCASLSNITIPNSVTNIGASAFSDCAGLMSVYYVGNSPPAYFYNWTSFSGDTNGIAYYLPGTTGWGTNYDGLPTMLWNPQIESSVTTNNGVISFTVTGYSGTDAALTIPAIINNLPVTGIGDGAFQNSSLTDVIIPNSVTSIGNDAFAGCTNLAGMIIPGGVTNLGVSAFAGCASLTSVTIPGSVASVEDYAFAECGSLTNVILSNGLTRLGDGVFENCAGLTAITIPNSVTHLGGLTFWGCTRLTTATIGSGVTNLGGGVFGLCPNLAGVYFTGNAPTAFFAFTDDPNATAYHLYGTTGWGSSLSGIPAVLWLPFSYTTSAGAITITGYTNPIGTAIIIPDHINGLPVTSIGNFAFDGCTSLTRVTIPNSVTNIENSVFWDCTSLTNVTIPGSVIYLGCGAFGSCFKLAGIYFTGNAPTTIFSFTGDTNLTAYYLPGTTGWSSFAANTHLQTVRWNPVIQTGDGGLGVRNHQFGFNITGATNLPVVVESCTNLARPVWAPVQTVSLTGGTYYFSDPQTTNNPSCFYQLAMP